LEDLILGEVGVGDAVLHVAGSQVVSSREEAQLDRTHGVTGVKNQLLLFKECLPTQAQLTQLLHQLQLFAGVKNQLLLFKECLLAQAQLTQLLYKLQLFRGVKNQHLLFKEWLLAKA
jgi:hypothetical protein